MWRPVDPEKLPISLRVGLGATPLYSAAHRAWFVGVGSQTFRHRVGVGTVECFAEAGADLQTQMGSTIASGDRHMRDDYYDDAAVAEYRRAGQIGATAIGPEIDNCGAPQTTQRFTQQAWQINGELANETDALKAQGLAREMYALYEQAIAAGKQALTPNPPRPTPPGPPRPTPPRPTPPKKPPIPGPTPVPNAQTDYATPIAVGSGLAALAMIGVALIK